MKRKPLYLPILGLVLISQHLTAQNAFNNATHLLGSSDNTGQPQYQTGTEVLNSVPGVGVTVEPGGSFEHVGQFYVARNGIWNTNNAQMAGTDYFGYAHSPAGADLPYTGMGIRGASSANGGRGAGSPSFGHLQLNSTGLFPVEGGMYISHSLAFNANGPGAGNVIGTPNSNTPDVPANAVVFSPTARITGANHANYIDGFASVTGVSHSFSLPIGDTAGFPECLHALTINNTTPGTVTARYFHANPYAASTPGAGISSVSAIGSWPISAPEGTQLAVNLPVLTLNPLETATLRLVGWTGQEWVNLSELAPAENGQPGLLTGIMRSGVTVLGIGSTKGVFSGQPEADVTSLTVWPNPVQRVLQVKVSSGQAIGQLQVVDSQGRSVLRPLAGVSSVDVSALTGGQYVVEVITTQGQAMRKHFVKQQ